MWIMKHPAEDLFFWCTVLLADKAININIEMHPAHVQKLIVVGAAFEPLAMRAINVNCNASSYADADHPGEWMCLQILVVNLDLV